MSSWREIAAALDRNELPARLFEAWEWGEISSTEELAIGIEDAWTSSKPPGSAFPGEIGCPYFK